jgi:predicted DNA-binding WGR domain protein
MRRFEFSEGGSNKFWEVTQQGADYTVRFGRIDTDGQSKTTQCASPELAEAEIAKLVREKLKKGYQEIGGQRNWRPPAVYDHNEHPRHFMNYVVSRFDPEAEADEGDDGEKGIRTLPALRDPERRAYAIHTDYDDEAGVALRRLDALMADAKAPLLRALIVGNWFSDA